MSASPKVRKAVIPARFGISGRYLLQPAIWDFIGQTDPDALSTFFPAPIPQHQVPPSSPII